MARVSQEAKERLPGQFISLKDDKETRTIRRYRYHEKITKQAKPYQAKQ
jgi:hypothetical protein